MGDLFLPLLGASPPEPRQNRRSASRLDRYEPGGTRASLRPVEFALCALAPVNQPGPTTLTALRPLAPGSERRTPRLAGGARRENRKLTPDRRALERYCC